MKHSQFCARLNCEDRLMSRAIWAALWHSLLCFPADSVKLVDVSLHMSEIKCCYYCVLETKSILLLDKPLGTVRTRVFPLLTMIVDQMCFDIIVMME